MPAQTRIGALAAQTDLTPNAAAFELLRAAVLELTTLATVEDATILAQVTALEETVDTETTGLVDLVAAVTAAVDALEVTVDTETTGLVDRVEALEATVDTAVTGLSAVVADHETRIDVLEP